MQRIRVKEEVAAEPHYRKGRPDNEVVKLSEDLIVVGSKGLGSIRQALMGSVSDSIVHHAPARS